MVAFLEVEGTLGTAIPGCQESPCTGDRDGDAVRVGAWKLDVSQRVLVVVVMNSSVVVIAIDPILVSRNLL